MPVYKVLSELEQKERYEECFELKKGIDSFKERFCFIFSREKECETEEDYLNYYLQFSDKCGEIIKSNIKYYVKEIKQKLEL